MQPITDRPVRFGELAGPLVHGASFFDWQLVATQEVAAAVDYPFEAILADDGIPFAPVVVATSVDRYPGVGDEVTVEVVPLSVGDTSVELLYEVVDGGGDRFAAARMTHVTIAPDGGARELPDDARAALSDARVDRSVEVGPAADGDAGDDLPTLATSFPVRSPHIEGAELAYFEEYPRFAGIVLEEYLEDCGTSLGELGGEKQPFRLRDWEWEFRAPVPFETTLRVECDVRSVDEGAVRVAHELSSGGRTNISGVTEYGCFDREGNPVPFDDAMLEPFRG
ncbi:thioesterase family protein [Halostella litorea]|uniref:thioesterase family protein n=1 Tax=Halostella litorea TaxID=2528831 RepID=UPI001091EDDE|nr:acyl-[acyl-carrier-protein] thioesterase [Halostella litorea]